MNTVIKKKLTDVGNSKGILLPQNLLKQYGLETEVIIELREDGILMKAYKPSFEDRVNDLKKNKDKVYARLKEQADDKEVQAYYENPNNTPFAEIDNEIL